jgi:FdhE protein
LSPGAGTGTIWSVRRARAEHLLGHSPHAEEILTFYAALTEAQESIADAVPASDWLSLVRSDIGVFPWLNVERLPLQELALPFRDFLSKVVELGNETIQDGARNLLAGEEGLRLESLRGTLDAWGQTDPHDFYARAFLEPVVLSIARESSIQPPDWTQNFCFTCAAPPQVAVFQDLPDALGHRSLMCSMCATEWRFQRLTCPHCGETEADKLPVHTAESITHVRIDACTTCSRYIKTVDLRQKGDAVPLVDELASLELDIWAQEQGLTKLQPNVLGL